MNNSYFSQQQATGIVSKLKDTLTDPYQISNLLKRFAIIVLGMTILTFAWLHYLFLVDRDPFTLELMSSLRHWPAVILPISVLGACLDWAILLIRKFTPWNPMPYYKVNYNQLQRFFDRWIILIVTAIALWSTLIAMAGPPNPEHFGDGNAFAGRIPISDATGYVGTASEMSYEGNLSSWAQRRPINTMLYSTRLNLSLGDPRLAMVIQTLIFGLAVGWLIRIIGRNWGIWAATATLAWTWSWSHSYLFKTLTETLGVTLGALALCFLLEGIWKRKLALSLIGVYALALALSARMGAMFILPLLIPWIAWRYRPWWKSGIFAIIALGLGLSTNSVLNKMYGDGSNIAGANFAHTAYGLATNTRWDIGEKMLADKLRGKPEKEQARVFYTEAWKEIKKDPSKLYNAMVHKNLIPFLNAMPHHFVDGKQKPKWLLILAFLVIICWLRKRIDIPFWLACITGLVFTSSLIYHDGGFRGYAATYPMMALIGSMGLISPRVKYLKTQLLPQAPWYKTLKVPLILLGILVVLMFIGPTLTRPLFPVPSKAFVQEASSRDERVFDTNWMRYKMGVEIVPSNYPDELRKGQIARHEFLDFLVRTGLVQPEFDRRMVPDEHLYFSILYFYDYTVVYAVIPVEQLAHTRYQAVKIEYLPTTYITYMTPGQTPSQD